MFQELKAAAETAMKRYGPYPEDIKFEVLRECDLYNIRVVGRAVGRVVGREMPFLHLTSNCSYD